MSIFSRLFGKHKEEAKADLPGPLPSSQESLAHIQGATSSVQVVVPENQAPAEIVPPSPAPQKRNMHLTKAGFTAVVTNPVITNDVKDVGNAAFDAMRVAPGIYNVLHKHRSAAAQLTADEKIVASRPITAQEGDTIISETIGLGSGARQQDVKMALSALTQVEAINAAAKKNLYPDAVAEPGKTPEDGDTGKSAAGPFPIAKVSPAKDNALFLAGFGVQTFLSTRQIIDFSQRSKPSDQMLETPSLRKPDKGLIKSLTAWDKHEKEMPPEMKRADQDDFFARAEQQWHTMSHNEKRLFTYLLQDRQIQARRDSEHLGEASKQADEYARIAKFVAEHPQDPNAPRRHVSESYSQEGPLVVEKPMETPAAKVTEAKSQQLN